MNNIRIITDKSGDFKFLVEYGVEMTCLNKWFTYTCCHTQASTDTRYDALKMSSEVVIDK